MSEEELDRLSFEERWKVPEHIKAAALLTTRERASEILMCEGWEFVARGEWIPLRGADSDIWRREVGGVVEWCEVTHAGQYPNLPEGQCWLRVPYECDPRLAED